MIQSRSGHFLKAAIIKANAITHLICGPSSYLSWNQTYVNLQGRVGDTAAGETLW